MNKLSLFVLLCFAIAACNDTSKNNIQAWQIGGKQSMSNTIFDEDEPENIKICVDEYKDIGFSTTINIHYDDNIYHQLFKGLCITVNAKKVKVRFATPSSGKMARGTFEVLNR